MRSRTSAAYGISRALASACGITQPNRPTTRRLCCRAYVEHADSYDQDTSAHDRWRLSLVDALPLRPGDTVLDVGCGSGL
jgi:ubiquinone/menaquinone biosynthesis C-methylase UbiE